MHHFFSWRWVSFFSRGSELFLKGFSIAWIVFVSLLSNSNGSSQADGWQLSYIFEKDMEEIP